MKRDIWWARKRSPRFLPPVKLKETKKKKGNKIKDAKFYQIKTNFFEQLER